MSHHYHYRRRHGGLLGLVLAVILYVLLNQGVLQQLSAKLTRAAPGTYAISHYVDGDTIAVDMNGTVETIRFIGIDTPETHKPNTPVQCYGPAAAAHTKNMIAAAGGRVKLQADPLSTDRDRYNRLLRYVLLPDGTNLNLLNIQQGYAFYYPYFPFSKATGFAAAERSAQAQNLGLWGHCTPTPSDHGGYKMDEPLSQQK